MIKIEKTEVMGWDPAIRGMRNPMNSWDKSDSVFIFNGGWDCYSLDGTFGAYYGNHTDVEIGSNDLDLITAPLYWWKEFDTYKVGTVANSCSTMHKIHAKEFMLDDFSHERLKELSIVYLQDMVKHLNYCRNRFLETNDKIWWWQMIQLLPSSYNQKRTVMLNYEVLSNIYKNRHNHKLDEWRDFCNWIKTLPYSEIITCEVKSQKGE